MKKKSPGIQVRLWSHDKRTTMQGTITQAQCTKLIRDMLAHEIKENEKKEAPDEGAS